MTALIIGCVAVMVATVFIGGLITVCKSGESDGICKYDYIED